MTLINLRQLVIRYAWAGPIIGFVVGFLFGPGFVWSFADYRLKSDSAALEQIKIEKEFYKRLQIIQNEILSALPHYITLRDKYLNNVNDPKHSWGQESYQTQNEYKVELEIIANKVFEYYKLEAKLSTIEGRSRRLIKLPLPPSAPVGMHIVTENGKQYLVSDPFQVDPLIIKIEAELKDLSKQTFVR